MSFGAVVRAQRRMRGLTLTEVAIEIGVSLAYLSRIERDLEKPPSDELVRRIADVVGLPNDEAFAAARRLPPDLRPHLHEVVALYRKMAAERREQL